MSEIRWYPAGTKAPQTSTALLVEDVTKCLQNDVVQRCLVTVYCSLVSGYCEKSVMS